MSKITNIAKKSSHKESKMESSMKHLFSVISKHSTIQGTPKAIRAWLTALAAASPARISVVQENEPESPELDQAYGLIWRQPFALFDQDTFLLKTVHRSLFGDMIMSSVSFSKWGIMLRGVFLKWAILNLMVDAGILCP